MIITMELELKSTRDHALIKKWAERHGACPTIEAPRKNDDTVLDLSFGNKESEISRSEGTTWEGFFRVFDSHEYSFIYTDDDVAGKPFFKFVKNR
jgi:hypothetical protein